MTNFQTSFDRSSNFAGVALYKQAGFDQGLFLEQGQWLLVVALRKDGYVFEKAQESALSAIGEIHYGGVAGTGVRKSFRAIISGGNEQVREVVQGFYQRGILTDAEVVKLNRDLELLVPDRASSLRLREPVETLRIHA